MTSRFEFIFPGTAESFKISDDIFGLVVDTMRCDISERNKIKLIISELYMNAYIHGNESDPDKSIDVTLEFDDSKFMAIVRDRGRGISMEKIEALRETSPDLEKESGRGLRIVDKLSDEIQVYRDHDDKFCIKAVRTIKKRPATAADQDKSGLELEVM